jgi:hypothetical protein
VEGSSSGQTAYGVWGTNAFSGTGTGGTGVYGNSDQGIGVQGYGATGIQGQANTTTGCGIEAWSQGQVTTQCGLSVTGTSSFDGNITITGSGTYSGTWSQSSDARLKKDIETVTNALPQILQLRGVTFKWRDPAKHGGNTGQQVGLIAQEVEQVFPEWVSTDKDGFRAVSTQGFPGLAVEAMRELSNENEALSNELSQVEQRVDRVANRPGQTTAGLAGSHASWAPIALLALLAIGLGLAMGRPSTHSKDA